MRIAFRAANRGTVLKTRQNKCIKGFNYYIIIAKNFATFANKINFWTGEVAVLRICFFKINLSSSVISRSLRELDISRTIPHKVNGR